MASSRVTISSSPGKMAASGVMLFSSHSSAVVRLFLVAIRLMLSPATTVYTRSAWRTPDKRDTISA